MAISLNGIAVSRGIAIGHVHKIERGLPDILESCIPEESIEDEVNRLQQALTEANQQLHQIRKKIPDNLSNDIAAFIDTHLLMLTDDALSEVPCQIIRTQHCNAEWSLKLQLDTLVNTFDRIDDPYLKTRRDDVIHVINRVLRILLREEDITHEEYDENRIIVTDDLTPADVVLLQHQGINGFITASGGPLSHTAILARSLGLAAITGIHHVMSYLQQDERIIIDGETGVILLDPGSLIEQQYVNKQASAQRYYHSLEKLNDLPAITLDKVSIKLLANAELPADIEMTYANNIDGIGLFRTEYLFMNRDNLPDEEEQFLSYRQLLALMNNQCVTIRTLDLGADKALKNQYSNDCPANPALGLRAIRLCLNQPELFRPQLRAILRASAFGKLQIMLPMLSNLTEISQTLTLINEIKDELSSKKIEYDPKIKIGGMIEVPAAAINAYSFSKHLDFMSIGTNDLIQYTLAMDRTDDEVNYLYQPFHPAVLSLIQTIINAGKQTGTTVSMCGEMAGDPSCTRLLLGMGLREFSMQPNAILEVKSVINKTRLDHITPMVEDIMNMEQSEQISEAIRNLNIDITH